MSGNQPNQQPQQKVHEPGDLLNGRYRVIQSLGKGGMATVFKCFDEITGTFRAVKIVTMNPAQAKTVKERFDIETNAFGELFTAPEIVRIFDVVDQGPEWLIVLEVVDGGTLKTIAQDFSPFTLKELKYYFGNILLGLNFAEQKGIIHNDIKPDNILLTKSGRPKISDFGISQINKPTGEIMQSDIAGTSKYFPPERALKITTLQSDIYSVGIMLYELSVGTAPFLEVGKDAQRAINAKQIKDKPIPPRYLNPTIPQSLENVILRMIEKDPEKRFKNALEAKKALDKVRFNDSDRPYIYNGRSKITLPSGKTKNFLVKSPYEKLPAWSRSWFSFLISGILLALFALLIILMVV